MGSLITVGSIAAFCIFFATKPALAIRAIATFIAFPALAIGLLGWATHPLHYPNEWLVVGIGLLVYVMHSGRSSR